MEQRIVTPPNSSSSIVVFSPQGRLDITTAWQFRLKLQECIEKTTPHIIVNLGKVNFIDSSGLTSLVAGMRDADKVEGSFKLCNVHPESKLVFEVTMMDSVFAIYDSEEEAINAAPEPMTF
ncbi:MAG: STAS domain-containing protein [Leptolyngbya sp. SIO3F4]|nr:STAS domain-containing protein [Leptolyngbya sp. SIO3F4]